MPSPRLSPQEMRARLVSGDMPPTQFREALATEPSLERDAWFDRIFEHETPDDGPDLPRGCVPYLACPIDAIASALSLAEVGPGDVIIDIGSGTGRAAYAIHWLTGARVVGIEVQQKMHAMAQANSSRWRTSRVSFLHGDLAERLEDLREGTVFFLYCPFSGARLEAFLGHLRVMSALPDLRICTVDLPLPGASWLAQTRSSLGVSVDRPIRE